MKQTEKIELDLFTWDVHFASNILGPGITSHPEEMKETYLESAHDDKIVGNIWSGRLVTGFCGWRG
ncbi:MAG: hypothetical protein JRK53_26045 [Deltaproteobacteria bacterium]|nr:hypothetical protein [Deltaproteobacteria bacterium]